MKKLIKKILKEGDFDWIRDIPPFIEITEPMMTDNPKNIFRLTWTNGYNEGNGVWADNYYEFNNTSNDIDILVRYIKILQNGVDGSGNLDINHLIDLFMGGHHDYVITDWIKGELPNIPDEDKEFVLYGWLEEDFMDMGFMEHDTTLERWMVTYFDKNGVEFKTKINMI